MNTSAEESLSTANVHVSSRSRFVFTAGIAAAALGAIVVLGWLTNQAMLVQISPVLVPMQFNTALGFLFCGTSLVLLSRAPRARVAAGLAILASLLGLSTFSQYLTGVDLGIDQALIEHYITVETSHSGRMAPNTALAFVLSGVALLLLRAGWNLGAVVLGMLVVASGAVALLGYASGIETAYGWGSMTRMALHTSAGFLVIGAATIVLAVSRLRAAGSLPAGVPSGAVSLSVLAVAVLMFQALAAHDAVSIGKQVDATAGEIEALLQNDLDSRVLALQRMGRRWQAMNGTPRELWDLDARAYLEDQPGYRTLAWADTEHVVRWIIPREQRQAIGLDIDDYPDRGAQANAVRSSGQPQVGIYPAELRAGSPVVVLYTPAMKSGRYDGLLLAINDFQTWFDHVLRGGVQVQFGLRLSSDGGQVLAESAREGIDVMERQATIMLNGNTLNLRLRPSAAYLDEQRSRLPAVVLGSGLVLALLAGFATRAGLLAARREHSLREEAVTRARHEHELWESEHRFSSAFNNSPIGFALAAPEGHWFKVNQALCEMTGYEESELVGKPFSEITHPDDLDKQAELRARLLSGEIDTYRMEKRYIRKDGGVLEVILAGSAVRGRDGKPSYFMSQLLDITTLRRALDELQRSNEELERFAYVASHDLQEPLRMIASYVQLLDIRYGDQLDDNARQFIGFAMDGAKRMRTLIQDLLNFSRLNSQAIELEEVDCNELVSEILDDLKPAIASSRSEVHVDSLPAVQADAAQLRQLFQNLISNALKYHDATRPNRIRVSAHHEGADWVFAISDTGIGMENQYLEQIFVIFQRLHNRADYEGNGIGLAICKKIVEAHRGRIWVESTPGEGTTFFFTWSAGIAARKEDAA